MKIITKTKDLIFSSLYGLHNPVSLVSVFDGQHIKYILCGKKSYPNTFGCIPCIIKTYRNLVLKQTD